MTTKSEEKLQRYRKNLDRVRELVQEVEERDALRNWQPPVSGEDIMRCFDMSPCKLVGEIKEQLREAMMDDEGLPRCRAHSDIITTTKSATGHKLLNPKASHQTEQMRSNCMACFKRMTRRC